jgi:hypothetical protein
VDDRRLPLLRPVIALPFQWQRDACHSPYLPTPLLSVADEVLRALADSAAPCLAHQDWGLRAAFHPPDQPTDLRGLTSLTCGSAWAALAGGLVVADRGGWPDPKVWATGGWARGEGIREVDHLTEKVGAAREFGADVVFVPGSQLPLPRTPATAGVEILPLDCDQPHPIRALERYLERLGLPPEPVAPFDRRRDYYLRADGGDLRDTYYRSHLLPDLIRHYRTVVERHFPGAEACALVSVVSDGAPELIPIEAGAFRPTRIVLLHTSDSRMLQMTRRVEEDLKACPETASIPREVEPFRDEDEMIARLPSWFDAHERLRGKRLIDLTLGTKPMTLALLGLAREGDTVVYWRHRQDRRRVIPGSQLLSRVMWGEPWCDVGSALSAPDRPEPRP